MFTHTDSRRKLIEWARGDFRVSKALIAGENCIVGDHYHRNKDETFLLLQGKARRIVLNDQEWSDVAAPYEIEVPRGNYHLFDLEPGSILLGVATSVFDPDDEVKGKP